MTPSASSAGFSMLELLVALAILAGLAVIVTGTMTPRPPIAPGVEGLLRVVANARTAVVLSGKAGLVEIGTGTVTFRDTTSSWGGVLEVGGRDALEHNLLVYPDGSFSGDQLSVRTAGGEVSVPGVYRSGADQ